eukprot:6342934-Amphidinium_carterae.1
MWELAWEPKGPNMPPRFTYVPDDLAMAVSPKSGVRLPDLPPGQQHASSHGHGYFSQGWCKLRWWG